MMGWIGMVLVIALGIIAAGYIQQLLRQRGWMAGGG